MSSNQLDQRVPHVPRPLASLATMTVRTIVVMVQVEFGVDHVGDISSIPDVCEDSTDVGRPIALKIFRNAAERYIF